jgi:glutathione S-transferase
MDIYNVSFTEKNISNPKNEQELMELGGKRQLPFMVDEEVRLYDSEAIADYIAEKYGDALGDAHEEKKEKLRVHRSGGNDTCTDGTCS